MRWSVASAQTWPALEWNFPSGHAQMRSAHKIELSFKHKQHALLNRDQPKKLKKPQKDWARVKGDGSDDEPAAEEAEKVDGVEGDSNDANEPAAEQAEEDGDDGLARRKHVEAVHKILDVATPADDQQLLGTRVRDRHAVPDAAVALMCACMRPSVRPDAEDTAEVSNETIIQAEKGT
ncbi:MAG: hypothetical protein FRX49_09643 [Trebouxia sp. A1-2]|nr:MAG: hypothetical protein FRX49_09643 [Trebouxia sp. A1-2]